jgi:two-component system chemotaxis sensor kinase CheA
LVVLKNQILHNDAVKDGSNPQLIAVVDQIDKAVRDLYDKTLGMRMTPLKAMFQKIQRIVRDVSISLGKPVELILEGEDTEVDRSVFELLSDPLVHLVRNSMDHGIEKPELRKERKKPATAKVKVSARQTGGSVVIEISDDGGGINKEKVLKKAIEKSLVPFGVDPQSIPDAQVYQYIFAPGFSTADKVSDLSGRGVGLDVVRSNIEKVHGKIDISSKANEGSSFKLTIPLSTAITDGIVVGIGQQQFIIPIHSIREIVRLSPNDYTRVSNHGTVVNVRDLVLPLIDLDQSLGQLDSLIAQERKLTQNSKASMVVVIESITGMMAFPVDQVIGQSQVVVKSMSLTKEIAEISGAAIMGDGNTMLILDPQAIIQRHLDHNVSAA